MGIKTVLLILVGLVGLIGSANATTYTCCREFETSEGTLWTGFDNISQWVYNPIDALTNNSDLFVEGNYSLTLSTNNVSNFTRMDLNLTNISAQKSYTNLTSMSFWLHVENQSNLSRVEVTLSDTAAFGHYVTYKINDYELTSTSGWNKVSLSIKDAGQYTNSSMGEGITIGYIRFRLITDAGKWSNVTFDDFRYGIKARPKFFFTFDDGWADNMDTVKTVLDINNQEATMFIAPTLIDTAGYLTLSQVQDLENNYGWDIGGHGVTDLRTLSPADMDTELQTTQQYLLTNGFSKKASYLYAYPLGGYNASVINETKKYYLLARGTTVGTYTPNYINNEMTSINPSLPYSLKWIAPDAGLSEQTYLDKINDTINRNGSMVLSFHRIRNNGTATGTTNYNLSGFMNLSNYLASRSADIDVITFGEYLNEIPPPPTRQDSSNQNTNKFISASITLLVFVLILSPVISRTPKEYKSVLALVVAAVGITFLIIYMSI